MQFSMILQTAANYGAWRLNVVSSGLAVLQREAVGPARAYGTMGANDTERKTGNMEELIDLYDADRKPIGKTIPREGAFLHEGEYMLYVLAIVQNTEGNYLITQRSMDKHWAAGWWEVTGGGVLSGETSVQAVVREVGEEVGLDVSAQHDQLTPVYAYRNVDLKRGDNYIVDIYHFHLDVDENDVTLQDSEAIGCAFATWEEIEQLADDGAFLHFSRLRQALEAEGAC